MHKEPIFLRFCLTQHTMSMSYTPRFLKSFHLACIDGSLSQNRASFQNREWHVFGLHTVSATYINKTTTVRTSFLSSIPLAFQLEHQPIPVFYYFSSDVFIGLKRWVVCYILFEEHMLVLLFCGN